MNETIQITVATGDDQVREMLIAQLSLIDFDAFEEKDGELVAFIGSNKFDETLLKNILLENNLNYTKTIIKEQNWNELWESNFPPVVVNDFCAIRAHFHQPFTDKQHEIIITPKM